MSQLYQVRKEWIIRQKVTARVGAAFDEPWGGGLVVGDRENVDVWRLTLKEGQNPYGYVNTILEVAYYLRAGLYGSPATVELVSGDKSYRIHPVQPKEVKGGVVLGSPKPMNPILMFRPETVFRTDIV